MGPLSHFIRACSFQKPYFLHFLSVSFQKLLFLKWALSKRGGHRSSLCFLSKMDIGGTHADGRPFTVQPDLHYVAERLKLLFQSSEAFVRYSGHPCFWKFGDQMLLPFWVLLIAKIMTLVSRFQVINAGSIIFIISVEHTTSNFGRVNHPAASWQSQRDAQHPQYQLICLRQLLEFILCHFPETLTMGAPAEILALFGGLPVSELCGFSVLYRGEYEGQYLYWQHGHTQALEECHLAHS